MNMVLTPVAVGRILRKGRIIKNPHQNFNKHHTHKETTSKVKK